MYVNCDSIVQIKVKNRQIEAFRRSSGRRAFGHLNGNLVPTYFEKGEAAFLRYVNSETVVKRDPHLTALPPNTLNHHLSVQACPFHQAKRCHMSYSRTSQYI